MTFLFYLGHPAHYLNIKVVAERLSADGHRIILVARDKEVLFDLIEGVNYKVYRIKDRAKTTSLLHVGAYVFKRSLKLIQICLKEKPQVLVGTDLSITHAAAILGKKSVILNENDAETLPLLVKFGFPFATLVSVPQGCSVGRFGYKARLYRGYHELAYLAPEHFTFEPEKVKSIKSPFIIIRLAAHVAHHDDLIMGLGDNIVRSILEALPAHYEPLISSERPISDDLEKFRKKIDPKDIHHYLQAAEFIVADSATMVVEAALLGTPALMFSEFAGRFFIHEQLEHKYHLLKSIHSDHADKLLKEVDYFLTSSDLKSEWKQKRDQMLTEQDDVVDVWTNLFLELAQKERKKQKVFIYLGHPAHYHNYRRVVPMLEERGAEVSYIVSPKDVLQKLLEDERRTIYWLRAKNKTGKQGLVREILYREVQLFKIIKRERPNVLVGTDIVITHIGKLFGINSLLVTEDDSDAVPLLAAFGYPFASNILAPENCNLGRFSSKAIRYSGYNELAYLHPDHFQLDFDRIKDSVSGGMRSYSLLRLSALNAHHDNGIHGIDDEFANRLVQFLLQHGSVVISSERELPSNLEQYRLKCHPSQMHHVLGCAKVVIGDSQTVSAESAVLGTPFIRCSDFVGRLSIFQALENEHQLGIGVLPAEKERIFDILKEWFADDNLYSKWSEKKFKLIQQSQNVAEFWTDSILKLAK